MGYEDAEHNWKCGVRAEKNVSEATLIKLLRNLPGGHRLFHFESLVLTLVNQVDLSQHVQSLKRVSD